MSNIEINMQHNHRTVSFSSIEYGDCFVYGQILFRKFSLNTSENAMILGGIGSKKFKDSDEVFPVKVTMNVEFL